ncbi:MAG TPA: electron transfer flavoprotein subunit alpha/FixB family protein [Candidatus Limnocylindrales bacterium]
MSGAVLVFVHVTGGEPDRLAPEILTFARSLHAPVESVSFAGEVATAALGTYGVSTAHLIRDERLAGPTPEARAAALAQLIERTSPVAFVGPGSERGNELVAHVAARLGQPMAANVISASVEADRVRLVRQRWAGSLLEDAWLAGKPHILTIAPHAVAPEPAATPTTPAVAAFEPVVSEKDFRVRVRPVETSTKTGISLSDAKVVVGGGRGVGSSEGFGELEELAALLGGAVGGSRVVTSNGWRPHADQIGQTGLRIAPDLYIACGISGAIQHIVGCKAAKRILAINTDPDSPIMAVADYAVIGDLGQVVPAISAEIDRRRGG